MTDLDTIIAGLGRDLAGGTAGLAVEADLRLDITTSAGVTTAARITGNGQRLLVETDRLGGLFTGFDRTSAGRIAELLAGTGLTVDVVGPAGRMATLGSGTSSRLGRLVSGSPRLAPHPWAAVRFAASNPGVQAAAVIAVAALVSVWSRRMTRPAAGS